MQNDAKSFWKDLKQYNIISSNKPSGIPDYLKDVNRINNYFVSSVDDIVNPNVTVPREYENLRLDVGEFKFAPVVENDIIRVLNKIKSNSAGIDTINIKMIRYCCPVLIPFLTHLINFCLENGVVLDDWKIAKVVPLHKTNAPKEPKDLRPISILPVLSKVLEK
ncbi:hypothetical protein ILUMI_16831, partial [Ignelater luminosus]